MVEPTPVPPSGAVRAHLRHLWSRRWVRRLTYVVASGATTLALISWTARQQFFHQWLLRKVDHLLQEETGLGLTAETLEFEPIRGRLLLGHFTLGGDLLQGDELEVGLEMGTLLTQRWHFWGIRLEGPRLRLDAARLARIHLKERPRPQDAPPKVILDFLKVSRGQCLLEEPSWGLPRAQFQFRAGGEGLGPNRVQGWMELVQADVTLTHGRAQGDLEVAFDLSDALLKLKSATVRSGET